MHSQRTDVLFENLKRGQSQRAEVGQSADVRRICLPGPQAQKVLL
jgi:hypothetical protein